ncbi:MAG TPA: PepSY domain-containing protein [Gammaproteobacteria bacterium]|nr:PepSY domain-containing protein [Gammaproteobacteria bacterium]
MIARHRQHLTWHERLRSVYLWHRYVGLALAVIAVFLALTGIALNHAHELGLDARRVRAGWLLDVYGIRAPNIDHAFRAGDRYVTALGTTVWLDDRPLGYVEGRLVGAAAQDGLLVIVTEAMIALVTAEGELIERVPPPAGVAPDALGRLPDGALALRAGDRIYRADAELLEWQADAGQGFRPFTAAMPPDTLRARILAAYRGEGLDWERVLRDLHSGRLFGRFGVYVMDAAGLALVLLALTGIAIWWQRRRARARHAVKAPD